MNEVLNLDEVAKLLKVSKRTVQREVELGKLEAFKVGRALRFTKQAVEEYMQNQKVKPGDKLDEESRSEEAA
jgi:excisionase family DNA binding protein